MMKKNYFILLLFIPFLSVAQCPDFLILTTQAEIDAFATNYPDCTGSDLNTLTITGEDIVNLNGLSQLESIGEFLTIQGTSIQDFTGLNNLEFVGFELRIQNNQNLVNFAGLENLIEVQGNLIIQNNESLINFTGFDNFEETVFLEIRNNQNLIDFTGMSSLSIFGYAVVSSNESLESFSGIGAITDVSFPLEGFDINNNNSLTSLEGLSGMSAQVFMRISGNDVLTSLDGLQNISYLAGMSLQGNDALTDISAIAYVPSSDNITIVGNSMLSNCSILSICSLLATGDTVTIQNNNTDCNSNMEVINNCPNMLNQITGTIRYDIQADGCDASDIDVSSVLIEVTDGTNILSTHTDQNGSYSLFVGEEGTYMTSVVTTNIPSYFSISPDTVETVFTATGETAEVDFCVEAVTAANDLKITLLPLEEVRPGFDTNFQIIVENVGTEVADGVVTLTLDLSRVTYLSGMPMEDTISGNQVLWTFSDIAPFSPQVIDFTVNSLPPPVNESGDLIDFMTTITPVTSDETPEDNISSFTAEYVNSQDPNDKIVTEGTEIFEEQVGEFLNYIVRFQNIGSAEAINVRVDDLLDDHLNLDSFRVLSSSHDYQLEITGTNNVSFIFDDINLPSIDVDEEGSNGFITYQIRTNTDLEIGDSVSNTANIFFDFNAPIVTNTVTTTVVEPLAINEFERIDNINVFPNPVIDILSVQIEDNMQVSQMVLYSLSGQELKIIRETTFDFSTYSKGIYFLKIMTNDGNITKKIIKK